jgi:hypothetical protein
MPVQKALISYGSIAATCSEIVQVCERLGLEQRRKGLFPRVYLPEIRLTIA